MIQDPNMAHVNSELNELHQRMEGLTERVRQLEEELAALRRQVPDVR